MKRVLTITALVLVGTSSAAFAAAPEALTQAVTGCCDFLAALGCPCCP